MVASARETEKVKGREDLVRDWKGDREQEAGVREREQMIYRERSCVGTRGAPRVRSYWSERCIGGGRRAPTQRGGALSVLETGRR